MNVAEISGDSPEGHEESLDLRIEEAKERVEQESGFYRSLTVAVVVCALLAVLNWLTGPESYWSAWVAIIWGALLAVKGLRLFVLGEWLKNWRQARLQRLLRK